MPDLLLQKGYAGIPNKQRSWNKTHQIQVQWDLWKEGGFDLLPTQPAATFACQLQVTAHVMLPARTHAGILATVKELDDYFARLPTEMLGGLVISSVPVGTGMDGIEIGGMDGIKPWFTPDEILCWVGKKSKLWPLQWDCRVYISAFTTDWRQFGKASVQKAGGAKCALRPDGTQVRTWLLGPWFSHWPGGNVGGRAANRFAQQSEAW